jgi:predicted RNA-binding Zn-ribbon protein involved in translation (DUF1610 family)
MPDLKARDPGDAAIDTSFRERGDGADSEDLDTCINCGYQTYERQSICPQCGGTMLTRRWTRRLGGLLILCGLVLLGIMAPVSYYTVPLLL